MQIFKHDAFRLSRSGEASQVVLLCHGSWDMTDGYTFIPETTTVHFYCGHGHYSIGFKVAKGILENQKDAKGGLTTHYQPKTRPPGVSDKSWADFVKSDKESFDSGQGKVAVTDSYGNAIKKQQIQNYSLGRYGLDDKIRPEEEDLWSKHTGGQFDPDVDLMMMARDIKRHKLGLARTRNLSDAIEAARQANNGNLYSTFHYAACRYVDGDGLATMKSALGTAAVSLP
jgi:hypothetical protein